MATPTSAALRYAAAYQPEDEILAAAREQAREIGVTPVPPATGAALRFLAAAVGARAVVEIGTGTGVSAVWLLRGMRDDGVLTTVDMSPDHQRIARETLAAAGFGSGRARFIPGAAPTVLPRLADGGYDIVFCDADPLEYDQYLTEALRLLRPGGVAAFNNALWHGRSGDPGTRDEAAEAVQALVEAVRERDDVVPALAPVGDGLLCVAKR